VETGVGNGSETRRSGETNSGVQTSEFEMDKTFGIVHLSPRQCPVVRIPTVGGTVLRRDGLCPNALAPKINYHIRQSARPRQNAKVLNVQTVILRKVQFCSAQHPKLLIAALLTASGITPSSRHLYKPTKPVKKGLFEALITEPPNLHVTADFS
jgi:hypothetical protein